MLRRLYLILFLLVPLTMLAETAPKREVRAVWLTTIGGIDWPRQYVRNSADITRQQQELTRILDRLQHAGINIVLLQTRIRGTVIYPSRYEPFDACLTGRPGQSPGYDPLAFAIKECHRRGMELHAWVVTIPVGKWDKNGCRQLRGRYPSLIRRIGQDGYMNPERRETARYLRDICEEITRRYDIDGIHLDYIRYPEDWRMTVGRAQARENITRIVREIHQGVKTLKPWVRVSCSPIGKADDLSRYPSGGWNAYSRVCQDATGWLRDGLMDCLFPMMYFRGNNFYPFAIDWKEQAHGRIIAPGLGIYFMSPREKNWPLEDITREMYFLRQEGMGHAFFRSQFLTADTKGIYRFTADHFNRYLALPPALSWESSAPPAAPAMLRMDEGLLSWTQVSAFQGPDIAYNVYGSDVWPVNTDDARCLLAVRRSATSLRLPEKSPYRYYAVTAVDRYGNESAAVQLPRGGGSSAGRPHLWQCSGNSVELPEKESVTDAGYILIESMQGVIITSRPYRGRHLDVAALPEGMYVLRSVNRKGVTHRLGFLRIKRH